MEVWGLIARRMPQEKENGLPGEAARAASPPVGAEQVATEVMTVGQEQEIDAILSEEGLSTEEPEAVGGVLGPRVWGRPSIGIKKQAIVSRLQTGF